jgi:spore germination protein GerM
VPLTHAVRLLVGALVLSSGLPSYVPAGTKLRSARVVEGVAQINMSEIFATRVLRGVYSGFARERKNPRVL